MIVGKLQLRELRVGDEVAFRAAVAEFATAEPDWPFAFQYELSASFSEYVERLRRWKHGEQLPEGFVANTYLVGAVGETIVGRVSLRHDLNDFLSRRGGHVGYGVAPSCRRLGYATEMLRLTMPFASSLGLKRLLLTCDADNVGSRRVIETNGGVFESETLETETETALRRYWIEL